MNPADSDVTLQEQALLGDSMKLMKYGVLLLILGITAGCTISAPGVRIHAPLPGVDIDLDSGHGGGVFCPPGQAKKGNC